MWSEAETRPRRKCFGGIVTLISENCHNRSCMREVFVLLILFSRRAKMFLLIVGLGWGLRSTRAVHTRVFEDTVRIIDRCTTPHTSLFTFLVPTPVLFIRSHKCD